MKTCKFLTILLLGGFLMLSCGGDPKGTPHTDDQSEEPLAAPSTIITVQEAEDMYHRYGNQRVPLIETSVNIDKDGNPIKPEDDRYVQATRSLSMDYKELKQYLAFIEQEAGEAKTDISGLRIYFSQYPNGKNDSRATVFINPIMEAGKKGDIRDDLSFAIKKGNGKSIAVAVGDIIKAPKASSNMANLTLPVQNTIQSLAINGMPWRPPPPPPNDSDYQ
ncbi:hypothetical protein [Dokdonia sp. Asnod3-C12]|uniref:hypothetical protein n=1 Tax=Dokdonia sp. Asnod3-C12 TaxID=3160575 RepID=UPI003863BB7A